MMSSGRIRDMVIANGQSNSNALTGIASATGFIIAAPAALTAACTVQVSLDDGVTWNTLQSNGSDVVVGAGKTIVITHGGWDQMRIHSAGAEGAQRNFQVNAVDKD